MKTMKLVKHPCTGANHMNSRNFGYFQLADDVEREFISSIDTLQKAGAQLEEISLNGLDEIIRLSHGAQEFLAHQFLQEAIDNFPDIISDYVPELLETALSFNSSDFCRQASCSVRRTRRVHSWLYSNPPPKLREQRRKH